MSAGNSSNERPDHDSPGGPLQSEAFHLEHRYPSSVKEALRDYRPSYKQAFNEVPWPIARKRLEAIAQALMVAASGALTLNTAWQAVADSVGCTTSGETLEALDALEAYDVWIAFNPVPFFDHRLLNEHARLAANHPAVQKLLRTETWTRDGWQLAPATDVFLRKSANLWLQGIAPVHDWRLGSLDQYLQLQKLAVALEAFFPASQARSTAESALGWPPGSCTTLRDEYQAASEDRTPGEEREQVLRRRLGAAAEKGPRRAGFWVRMGDLRPALLDLTAWARASPLQAPSLGLLAQLLPDLAALNLDVDSHTHVFAARDLVTDAKSRLAVIHNGAYPAYDWNSRERRWFRQLDIGANTPFHWSELRF